MITFLCNVFSGRYRHWNDAHLAQFNLIWERLEVLPEPWGTIFREFLVASLVLVEGLLSPDKGKDRVLPRDPLLISALQFKELHYVQISAIAGLFAAVNPKMRRNLKNALILLLDLGHGTFSDERSMSVFDTSFDSFSRDADLMNCVPGMWKLHIVPITGTTSADLSKARQDRGIASDIVYTMIFGIATKNSFSEVRKKLKEQ